MVCHSVRPQWAVYTSPPCIISLVEQHDGCELHQKKDGDKKKKKKQTTRDANHHETPDRARGLSLQPYAAGRGNSWCAREDSAWHTLAKQGRNLTAPRSFPQRRCLILPLRFVPATAWPGRATITHDCSEGKRCQLSSLLSIAHTCATFSHVVFFLVRSVQKYETNRNIKKRPPGR